MLAIPHRLGRYRYRIDIVLLWQLFGCQCQRRARNVECDQENQVALAARDRDVAVVWECELRDAAGLAARLRGFLGETTT